MAQRGKREEREKVRRRNVAWLILHDRGVRKGAVDQEDGSLSIYL